MSSPLGYFGASSVGKIDTLSTDLSAHIADVSDSVHGATSASTANKIMSRDSNGRVNVIAPAASDSSTLVPTTAWVQGEISGAGTVTQVSTGTGLTGGPVTTTGTISLANTAVTPGSYTFSSVTVDAQGRLTAASSGTPVLSVTATAPVASTGGTAPVISMVPATASTSGHMTSAYASKLDGIAAGAQVNVVSSVFGRTGAIAAVSGDYTIQEISGVTVSDSGPSGGSDGDVWFEY